MKAGRNFVSFGICRIQAQFQPYHLLAVVGTEMCRPDFLQGVTRPSCQLLQGLSYLQRVALLKDTP